MAVNVGEIVATLNGDTKGFEQAMQRSNQELLAIGAASVSMGNVATEAFNYIVAGAINAAGTIQRWTVEVSNAVEKTEKLSHQLGIGERTLEAWGAKLKESGTNQQVLAGSMRTLSSLMEGLGSGSTKSVEAFDKLNTGLTVTELAGMNTEQVIRLLADKFATMSDGAEKAALGQQFLGRSWKELLPLLNSGSAGLDQAAKDAAHFGDALDDVQRSNIKAFDNASDKLTRTLDGFKASVAAAFAPSLTKTIELMTSAVSYAKSIFTEFANAAEKLFIRFGAIAAVIEIVGKQIFSLSVLNKEAWQQTLQQVEAIDKWAAAEIKAVDAVKNSTVEMKTATTQAKEYTVSQKTLGEQIVQYTQIQVKAHQEAKQAIMERIAAEIELGIRQKEYAAEVSKQVFGEIFEAEERRIKDTYAGSAVMIDNIKAKLKGLADMHEDIKKGQDAATQAYIDQAMAADAALVEQTAAEVRADGKNQEYQGKFIVMQEQKRQAMLFGWKDVFGSMSQSASFAFGQIRASFGQSIVDLTQGTASWGKFWKSTQGALLNSSIQWGIDVVGSFIAKNAMILATETITATSVTAIWSATSAAVLGAFGAMAGGIATFFTATIIPMFAAIGEVVMGFLSAIAGALDISIFGAPFSIPVWAAVALVAAAVGAISAFAFGAFAEGGIITKPTMALMGEAGPEAVIPLSKLGQLGGGGRTTVVVELDGRTIAKSVFDHMPSVWRIRGAAA